MLNTVTIMGRLTADPELRTTPSGLSVTSFTLAVDRDFQKQGAEKATDWIDVTAWRQTADFITRYFQKGRMMIVKGSLQTRTYTDKDGKNRKAWDVIADQVYFGDSKRDSDSNGGYSRQESAPRNEEPAVFSSGSAEDFTPIIDDDLPF